MSSVRAWMWLIMENRFPAYSSLYQYNLLWRRLQSRLSQGQSLTPKKGCPAFVATSIHAKSGMPHEAYVLIHPEQNCHATSASLTNKNLIKNLLYRMESSIRSLSAFRLGPTLSYNPRKSRQLHVTAHICPIFVAADEPTLQSANC